MTGVRRRRRLSEYLRWHEVKPGLVGEVCETELVSIDCFNRELLLGCMLLVRMRECLEAQDLVCDTATETLVA